MLTNPEKAEGDKGNSTDISVRLVLATGITRRVNRVAQIKGPKMTGLKSQSLCTGKMQSKRTKSTKAKCRFWEKRAGYTIVLLCLGTKCMSRWRFENSQEMHRCQWHCWWELVELRAGSECLWRAHSENGKRLWKCLYLLPWQGNNLYAICAPCCHC